MADSSANSTRAPNPWVLHLQKLALELKCPLCLNLFSRPLLLPCDHIFCNSCIPRSSQCGFECPMCKSCCTDKDLRPLAFVENIVAIYKGLNALSGANLFQLISSVAGRPQKDNSSSGHSVSANKLIQTQAGGIQEYRAVQIDINRLEQTSPGSPPSFGDIKGSDNESSEQGSEHSLKSYPVSRSVKRSFDDRTRQEHVFSASETEGPLRDSGILKKLNYGPEDVGVKSSGNIRSTVLPSDSLVASNSELELKSGVPLASETLPPTSEHFHANKYICGFCQSSRISELTGSMLHYDSGNQVVGQEAACSNVIHVHSKCIEWAPQVYYVGDTVKNLKAELARGSKLKCSRCGLKGAALGCYMKSCRRSFHVPCAAQTPNCRWDWENFLMLCPSHTSVKFPNEKSGKYSKNNPIVPPQITPQKPDFWASSPNKAKEWLFCGSALPPEEKLLLVRFGNMIGVGVSKFWRPDVTHVIAATDERGSCTRTLKVLMAILNGSWVLKLDWIEACMEAMRPVNEEPYEVSFDNHGSEDGPKTGRLRALNKAPKLFDGLSFYFSGDFIPGFKEDLQSLVITAGGSIWKSKEELLAQIQHQDDKAAPSKILIVYNVDSPIGLKLGEEISIIWGRLNEAENFASKTGSQVIGHTWLLESIAAHKLQPLGS